MTGKLWRLELVLGETQGMMPGKSWRLGDYCWGKTEGLTLMLGIVFDGKLRVSDDQASACVGFSWAVRPRLEKERVQPGTWETREVWACNYSRKCPTLASGFYGITLLLASTCWADLNTQKGHWYNHSLARQVFKPMFWYFELFSLTITPSWPWHQDEGPL